MFSIVAKTNKGRRYYYLREQRRIGGKVRPKDIYLGRMDAGVVPEAARDALHAHGMFANRVENMLRHLKHESERAFRLLDLENQRRRWICQRLNIKRPTVADALAWWKIILEAQRFMDADGERTDKPKERRWMNKAAAMVAELEVAQQSNRIARR